MVGVREREWTREGKISSERNTCRVCVLMKSTHPLLWWEDGIYTLT